MCFDVFRSPTGELIGAHKIELRAVPVTQFCRLKDSQKQAVVVGEHYGLDHIQIPLRFDVVVVSHPAQAHCFVILMDNAHHAIAKAFKRMLPLELNQAGSQRAGDEGQIIEPVPVGQYCGDRYRNPLFIFLHADAQYRRQVFLERGDIAPLGSCAQVSERDRVGFRRADQTVDLVVRIMPGCILNGMGDGKQLRANCLII